MLPTAAQTPACGGGQSPFARNTRNHFARFVIIDDVAYNGRDRAQCALVTLSPATISTVAQPQDHLACPFLLFVGGFRRRERRRRGARFLSRRAVEHDGRRNCARSSHSA